MNEIKEIPTDSAGSPVAQEPEVLFSEEEITNIRVIKLMTGEDIIGCIHAFNSNVMIVRRPCKITNIVTKEGNNAVILLKWHAFSTEETHAIQMSAIVSVATVTGSMVKFFVNSTQKQIALEKEGDLVVETPGEFEWPSWMNDSRRVIN